MSTNKAKSRKGAITNKGKMLSAEKIISEEPSNEETENRAPNSEILEEPVEVDTKAKKPKARKQAAKTAKKLTDTEQDHEEPSNELAIEQEISGKKDTKKIGKGKKIDTKPDKSSAKQKQPQAIKKNVKGKQQSPVEDDDEDEQVEAIPPKQVKKTRKVKKVEEKQSPVEEEDDKTEEVEVPKKQAKKNSKGKKADNKIDKDQSPIEDQAEEQVELLPAKVAKPVKGKKASSKLDKKKSPIEDQTEEQADEKVEEDTSKVSKPMKIKQQKKGKEANTVDEPTNGTEVGKLPKKRVAKEKKTNAELPEMFPESGNQDNEAYQSPTKKPKKKMGKTDNQPVSEDFLQACFNELSPSQGKPPKKKAKKAVEHVQVDVISTSSKEQVEHQEKLKKSKPKKNQKVLGQKLVDGDQSPPN